MASKFREYRASSLPQINEQTLENFNRQSLDVTSEHSNGLNEKEKNPQ
jgi:hypothetical protein